MKNNIFLGLTTLLAVAILLSSCNKDIDYVEDLVGINITTSLTQGKLMDLGDSEKIRVDFTAKTETEISTVHASIYVQDAKLFKIEGDNVELDQEEIQHWNGPHLRNEAAEGAVFHFNNIGIDGMEYALEQEIDFTAYPTGTCFSLTVAGRGNNPAALYDSDGIFFCKKN